MLCPGLKWLGSQEEESCFSAHWLSALLAPLGPWVWPRDELSVSRELEGTQECMVVCWRCQSSPGLFGRPHVLLRSKRSSVFWGMYLSGPIGLKFSNDKALGLGQFKISWSVGSSLGFLRQVWVPSRSKQVWPLTMQTGQMLNCVRPCCLWYGRRAPYLRAS